MFFINPFIYAAGADFESIATVTVGSGGASSIEFTSIPGTYQHLQVRLIGRETATSGGDSPLFLTFNSDSGSNYTRHFLVGNGSTASAGATTSAASSEAHGLLPKTATDAYGAAIVDVLDYASTSKNKTVRTFLGWDANGTGSVAIVSGLWMSTSAVTTLRFVPTSGVTIKQHSTYALYGVRA